MVCFFRKKENIPRGGGSLMHGTTRTHFTNTLINVVPSACKLTCQTGKRPQTLDILSRNHGANVPVSSQIGFLHLPATTFWPTQTSTVTSPEPLVTQRWVDIGWNLNVGCTLPLIIRLSTAEGGCYPSHNHLYHKSLLLFDFIARLTTFAWLLTAKSSRLSSANLRRNFIWCFQSWTHYVVMCLVVTFIRLPAL